MGDYTASKDFPQWSIRLSCNPADDAASAPHRESHAGELHQARGQPAVSPTDHGELPEAASTPVSIESAAGCPAPFPPVSAHAAGSLLPRNRYTPRHRIPRTTRSPCHPRNFRSGSDNVREQAPRRRARTPAQPLPQGHRLVSSLPTPAHHHPRGRTSKASSTSTTAAAGGRTKAATCRTCPSSKSRMQCWTITAPFTSHHRRKT